MAAKAANFGPDLMRYFEKAFLLQLLDVVWKEHLLTLDHLRQGIGLRAYGQRDPLNEYKSEAFALFNAMLDDLKERVTGALARIEVGEAPAEPPPPMITVASHPDPYGATDGSLALADAEPVTVRIAAAARADLAVDLNDPATWAATPRNALCPCGSGRKFKHCHGKI
jgi:preprotein translocase subunit SecA